jgi:hypothetical protein
MTNIQKHPGELTSLLKNFEPQEQKIYQLTTAAPAINRLDKFQRRTAVAQLMLTIHVITGWSIPEKEMMVILVDQFEKKLTESYPVLNVSEIEFAFRAFGVGINDWGKQMNLSLIDEVLNTYLGQRSEVQRKAENKAANGLKSQIFSDEDIKNERRGQIEAFYQAKRSGKKKPLFLPFWVDVLIEDHFIDHPDQFEQFIDYCLANDVKFLYQKS